MQHQELTHFKTPILCIIFDSFQDPYVFHPNHPFQQMPGSELYQPSPKLPISRPPQWKSTVFKSPWETTFNRHCWKSPWETTSSDKLQIPLFQWNLEPFVKIRRKTQHMHLDNSSQDASSAPPAFSRRGIHAKTKFFQDPKNLTSTVDSSNRVWTLSHWLWHRTRTS